MLLFVYTLMADDLGVESNEAELDRIFEEKLYVNKRQPLAERNAGVVDGKEAWALKKESVPAFGGKDEEKENTKMSENRHVPDEVLPSVKDGGRYAGALPFLQQEDAIDIKYAGDGQAGGGKGPGTEQSEHNDLADKSRRVTFTAELHPPDGACLMGLAEDRVDASAADEADKEKMRMLEIEFNKMMMAHKETIRIRSKLYRFIYSEVSAVQNELVGRIASLEKENDRLRRDLSHVEKKAEKYRMYIKAYHQVLAEKICAWKKTLEKRVCEYLSRRVR